MEECEKHAFSDGKYYKIDMEKSLFRGPLIGICQLCPSNKTIKASFKSPSNFTTHIKVRSFWWKYGLFIKQIHPNFSLNVNILYLQRKHADDYQAFLDYRKSKRQQPKDWDRESVRITSQFSQKQFETNVTNYVLESMAPFCTVEMPSFRKIFDSESKVKICYEPLKDKHSGN